MVLKASGADGFPKLCAPSVSIVTCFQLVACPFIHGIFCISFKVAMLHCPGGRAASDQQSAITVEFPAVCVHCFRQPARLLSDSGLNLGRTKRMKKTVWSVRMRCWKLGVAVRKVFPMNFSQCIPAKVLESMEMLGGKTELSIRFGLFMFIRVGLFNP